MLVLSRHLNESIVIGDDVVITVIDIRSDKIRLGIEAPKDIPVHRKEIYEAIQYDNELRGAFGEEPRKFKERRSQRKES